MGLRAAAKQSLVDSDRRWREKPASSEHQIMKYWQSVGVPPACCAGRQGRTSTCLSALTKRPPPIRRRRRAHRARQPTFIETETNFATDDLQTSNNIYLLITVS